MPDVSTYDCNTVTCVAYAIDMARELATLVFIDGMAHVGIRALDCDLSRLGFENMLSFLTFQKGVELCSRMSVPRIVI
jgi:hypothetical protein